MNYPGFLNGSHTLRSRTANLERTVNWYLEKVDGTGKSPVAMLPTPGTTLFAQSGIAPGAPASPVRALFYQDGRCFAVSGPFLLEILATQNVVFRGSVALDGWPASICSNGTAGHQLFITSGGHGYIFDLISNGLSEILASGFPTPVKMGAFVDGYFLALKDQSIEFHISGLENGLTWDPLDVAQVSQTTDNIQAMWMNHRDVWLFGSQTTTVWTNLGDPLFPFAPIPGALIMQGILAPWSAAVLDNTLYWLGSNAQGQGIVYRANGYTPERISDFGLEFRLAQYPRLDDAIAWSYQQEGHAFYVLYLPTPISSNEFGMTHWVFDVSTGVWHERAVWDEDLLRWLPHRGRCHTVAFGHHLIGDRASGAIYALDLNVSTDALSGA